MKWINQIAVWLIVLYQKWLSPICAALGAECRFYPSCSEYSRICFKHYTWPKALAMSLWRLLRCQPFAKGGVDMIEDKNKGQRSGLDQQISESNSE